MIYLDVTCKMCNKPMSEMFVRMLVDGKLKFVPCGLLCSCGYYIVKLDDVNSNLKE